MKKALIVIVASAFGIGLVAETVVAAVIGIHNGEGVPVHDAIELIVCWVAGISLAVAGIVKVIRDRAARKAYEPEYDSSEEDEVDNDTETPEETPEEPEEPEVPVIEATNPDNESVDADRGWSE